MVSLPTPKCLGVTQGSLGVVWLVLGPHHGDSHTHGSRCGGWAPKGSYGCPNGVELVSGHHQECSGVLKLVMELHHVSQGGNQEEFRDDGASVWISPCEF